MKKNMAVWLVVFFFYSEVLVNHVFAEVESNKQCSLHTTEPLSYLLLLAGGVSLAAFRRWKTKRSLKNIDKQS